MVVSSGFRLLLLKHGFKMIESLELISKKENKEMVISLAK